MKEKRKKKRKCVFDEAMLWSLCLWESIAGCGFRLWYIYSEKVWREKKEGEQRHAKRRRVFCGWVGWILLFFGREEGLRSMYILKSYDPTQLNSLNFGVGIFKIGRCVILKIHLCEPVSVLWSLSASLRFFFITIPYLSNTYGYFSTISTRIQTSFLLKQKLLNFVFFIF